MKLHFTSIDQPILQGLADALGKGHRISVSPEACPEDCDGLVIDPNVDVDNADIATARSSGIEIYSIPQLIYTVCQDKQRIVVSGSTGKKGVAHWIILLLSRLGKSYDYAFYDIPGGFDSAVKISDAPIIVIEGSEHKCSVLDPVPQFLRLNHHIALITDLSNQYEDLYPSFDKYVREFDRLADSTPKAGSLIYCEDDDLVTVIGGKERPDVRSLPYTTFPGSLNGKTASLTANGGSVEISVSGKQDLEYLGGAYALLKRFSITEEQFYQALKTL